MKFSKGQGGFTNRTTHNGIIITEWPAHGKITISGVHMIVRKDLDDALKAHDVHWAPTLTHTQLKGLEQ